MSANLLNLRSLGFDYQDTLSYHDPQSRISKALESIAGEAERDLNRADVATKKATRATLGAVINWVYIAIAEQLQSHVRSSQVEGIIESTNGQLLDQIKLEYISQKYLQNISVVAILLLPGIFVLSLLSTSSFDQNKSMVLWVAITVPLTTLATLAVLYAWRMPIIYEPIRREGFHRWVSGLVSQY